jgi:hypothetical protein
MIGRLITSISITKNSEDEKKQENRTGGEVVSCMGETKTGYNNPL